MMPPMPLPLPNPMPGEDMQAYAEKLRLHMAENDRIHERYMRGSAIAMAVFGAIALVLTVSLFIGLVVFL